MVDTTLMSKCKFLFYTRAPGGGGAERVFAGLASHFARQGHSVWLVLDADGDRVGLEPAVQVVIVGDGLAGVRKLATMLREVKPDVALSAIAGNGTKLVLARLRARSGTKVVVSFHGFEEYRTGKLSAAAYFGLRLQQFWIRRIVAVSDALKNALIDRWGADPARIVRIYNPVPLRLPAVDAATLALRAPNLVAVGRLSPEKGFADLIAAFALVKHPGATLTIAGDGPERERLAAQIVRAGLTDRVRLAGFMSPASLYDEARLCVIPSRTEAFGMVAVEALDAGLPVVATDCAGLREVLGPIGRIVPVGDAAAMAAAIDASLAEPPGDPAPRQARARLFSAEAGFTQWQNLLDQVMREG
jgi:glycosyltransferase involved in cell wall biosynthesis